MPRKLSPGCLIGAIAFILVAPGAPATATATTELSRYRVVRAGGLGSWAPIHDRDERSRDRPLPVVPFSISGGRFHRRSTCVVVRRVLALGPVFDRAVLSF